MQLLDATTAIITSPESNHENLHEPEVLGYSKALASK